jgi:hypothetical protein
MISSSLLDNRIKYREPCPFCRSPLELSFFLNTNIYPMPFREADGYFIASDKLSIWPMSKNSQEYKVEVFLHRQDDGFHLQFSSEKGAADPTKQKIAKLTQDYANRMAHSSFEACSQCNDCRRYERAIFDLRLDFKTMRTQPAITIYDSFLYLQSLLFGEAKVYMIERVGQKISLWAGKMSNQRLEELQKSSEKWRSRYYLPMHLQLPDFPFEQMPEDDLLRRLDTLLLFS